MEADDPLWWTIKEPAEKTQPKENKVHESPDITKVCMS